MCLILLKSIQIYELFFNRKHSARCLQRKKITLIHKNKFAYRKNKE